MEGSLLTPRYALIAQLTYQVLEVKLHNQSLQESLTSLYTPPYASQKKPVSTTPPTQPKNAFMAEKRFNNPNLALGIPTIPIDSNEELHVDEGRVSFWPILLLSLGANLLTVGLLQLFFSDNGYLRLEWNSSYWFLYCLGALPLFFFGFKKVNGMKS